VGLGAIVVVGGALEALSSTALQTGTQDSPLTGPLEGVEIMGRSMVDRMVERFVRAGVEVVTVLVPAGIPLVTPVISGGFADVKVQVCTDFSGAVTEKFAEYASDGIEHSFLIAGSLYTETDLLDLFYFHREARQPATRACERQVPLDLWVVNCAKAQNLSLESLFAQCSAVSYFIRDYVNSIAHARDLRRLVSDVLRGRCMMRPSGVEVRPGIWIEDGADVHRRARIVAPAYIGSGSKVREDTLITRCSSIERDCFVDYGTVVEDSSILANTHIGIWLDVAHSVADGNKLFNLERNVILEISDPSVMRANGALAQERKMLRAVQEPRVKDFELQEKTTPTQKVWQFGANLIQG
jgi:NDP-sugar pyrophosphorylase family protein